MHLCCTHRTVQPPENSQVQLTFTVSLCRCSHHRLWCDSQQHAIVLLVGWQEGYMDCRNFCFKTHTDTVMAVYASGWGTAQTTLLIRRFLVCFMRMLRIRMTEDWESTPTSQVRDIFCYVSVSSCLNQILYVSTLFISWVLTPVSWPVSLSRMKCLDSSHESKGQVARPDVPVK